MGLWVAAIIAILGTPEIEGTNLEARQGFEPV
jgi:hypothetical protein